MKILICFIPLVFSFAWQTIADTFLLIVMKNDSVVNALSGAFKPPLIEQVAGSIPAAITTAYCLRRRNQLSQRQVSVIALFGTLFGYALPIYVQTSTWIYRYSPNAIHGGYTGDALAKGFSFFISYALVWLGLSLGKRFARV